MSLVNFVNINNWQCVFDVDSHDLRPLMLIHVYGGGQVSRRRAHGKNSCHKTFSSFDYFFLFFCPCFYLKATIDSAFTLNRRQWQLEFAIRLHFDGMLQEDGNLLLMAPQPLNVRVFESDGSYEHQITLAGRDTVASVPWYSRGRAMKRKKGEVLGESSAPPSVQSGGAATTQSFSDVPVFYVQLDPLLDHVAPLRQQQPASMWRAQLTQAKDIYAQFDAVDNLLPASSATAVAALQQVKIIII